MAVIFLVIIPWGYVFETYVKKAGDRWGRAAPAVMANELTAS